MSFVQKIGLFLFAAAFALFTLTLGLERYQLSEATLGIQNEYHKSAILEAAAANGMLGKRYASSFEFVPAFKKTLESAKSQLDKRAKTDLPEGVKEWDFRMGSWQLKDYTFQAVRQSAVGPVSSNPLLFLWMTFGLAILGGLLYILPQWGEIPGIKNNHIYHNAMTRGLTWGWRAVFLSAGIIGLLLYGVYYMNKSYLWPAVSALIALLIIAIVAFGEKQVQKKAPRSASPGTTAWLGILAGVYLIGFYLLLYWMPQHITPWIVIVDPISKVLNGGPASQWFLYGLLYTLIVLVMGLRMMAKYRHNRYQLVRTGSVMFFQTAFAFLLPEILVRLNQPYYDFKNIWPLNYTFFFDWNIKSLLNSGALGTFMLVWGIVLALVGVPVFTWLFGKRWYCSWVCGCGGLAETLGDPYRQLSDKSLRAWKYERWIIHGVLVFAVGMTVLVLYTYFTGSKDVLSLNTETVRTWYGFLIGSAFAGVVGTGFYPLMGNRVWCRFGCPLAAYLGLVQRFQSRFRITTNGGQCISCGNCSTYCEMGIDVRHYAQRGQDIVRASCVGCGVCAAVCPRGVLRLENSSLDISQRTEALRTIHIAEDRVSLDF
ncbi:MAG TPA: 4Fe-4S binding protein [Saprospiraceae bacterium]|nr:4Fe-4S binding protein [Saprospiraceae bacterium]HMQ81923.1 4Fe-4S binding protein [Saprospiraceae bacterium]